MVRISDKPMILYVVHRDDTLVYIGQTVLSLAQRRGKHLSEARLGRGAILGAAIRKHGADKFVWAIHSIYYNQADLCAAEKHFIAKYAPKYNVQEGGKLSFTPWNKDKKEERPEVIENIKKSAAKRKRTPRGSYSSAHTDAMSEGACVRARLLGKPFIHHQSGQVFTCKSDAGKALNLNPQRIRDVLSDKHRMKSYLGQTFSYLD
jgi:hypothetical protein